jgi:hypothetical protein
VVSGPVRPGCPAPRTRQVERASLRANKVVQYCDGARIAAGGGLGAGGVVVGLDYGKRMGGLLWARSRDYSSHSVENEALATRALP